MLGIDTILPFAKDIFDRIVKVTFAIILALIILAIIIGVVQLVNSVWALIRVSGVTGNFIGIIADILTLFVLVELSRSLVDYFESSRLRMTFIVDAAIVFLIRELMIGVFKHEIEPDMMYAYSAVLLVLGALRVASILLYQRERGMPNKRIESDA
jgi:uncharacterized membrane protein (DUF373 family)